ncbi:unnamed protein product [Phytomonas sp. Hart1]|nr:unnamed protein product [Phytomonas sp. Hart1]|eukprot:CCW68672.1 unnamed protein product [Phytomonas sp. isolate Hart1]
MYSIIQNMFSIFKDIAKSINLPFLISALRGNSCSSPCVPGSCNFISMEQMNIKPCQIANIFNFVYTIKLMLVSVFTLCVNRYTKLHLHRINAFLDAAADFISSLKKFSNIRDSLDLLEKLTVLMRSF